MTRTLGLTAIKSRPEIRRIITEIFITYYTGKVQLDINQQLGGLGIAFITGSQQSYWHTDENSFVAGGIQRYAGEVLHGRFLQQ